MTNETLLQGILIGIWGTALLFSLIWYILVAISNYLLFEKAGYAGWKSLIPFYNLYIQQCITFGYEKRWFILLLLIPLVGPLYGIYLVYSFGRSFGLSALQAVLYVFFTPIFNLYLAFNDGSRYQGSQEFFID
ncbi:hypothetical protein JOA01_03820 [Streptococcus parasuis]|uniref:DUF5684 domain-containing protein n=1 Tax=Streptococcus parasuis TaxID=1501662 RepID=UPI001C2C492E|nr:DUF5684 domain-containing protein [Streptococcus parasuis]MBV1943563.1 hypothetical protein [Streptococcus parasuis]MDG3212871.1 DUF5684 domain-containing protein [Streptococcus suis]QXF06152.1 hypothetical protein JOA01_03820 [Streptococcus parasuis]